MPGGRLVELCQLGRAGGLRVVAFGHRRRVADIDSHVVVGGFAVAFPVEGELELVCIGELDVTVCPRHRGSGDIVGVGSAVVRGNVHGMDAVVLRDGCGVDVPFVGLSVLDKAPKRVLCGILKVANVRDGGRGDAQREEGHFVGP